MLRKISWKRFLKKISWRFFIFDSHKISEKSSLYFSRIFTKVYLHIYFIFPGDSKRAMDEYTSEIMLGGHNTIVIHNICEDSLLATPIILDLVILAELCSRITFKKVDTDDGEEFSGFHSILSILSYLCKAPLVPHGTPVINALFRQRAAIENILRACLSLPPEDNMLLEHKVDFKI